MYRLAFVSLVTCLMAGSATAQQGSVQRGEYLVNTIMTCQNCHTPRGAKGAMEFSKDLSGGLTFDEPPFKVTAANITPDPDTGIGKWSEADIKKALLEGVRPNGSAIAAVMPYSYYKVLTPGDLNSIVAYLKTVKPIANKVPDPIYKMPVHPENVPNADKAMSEADMKDKVKHGFYLVTIGHCMECHTPRVKGELQFKTSYGAGGQEFPGPWGKSVSRNITSSKTKGIGGWTDAEIKNAITKGISKDGSHLKPPMGFPMYAKMTNDDLDAIVAYLRTVPAVN
jgi:mono/diheme cytochrome c family protein